MAAWRITIRSHRRLVESLPRKRFHATASADFDFVSRRGRAVPSFKVMDVVARAAELEAAGRSISHLEVGQPQAPAPAAVRELAKGLLDSDRLGYTPAMGIQDLRKAIASHYSQKYAVDVPVDPDSVIVTTGSSAGFLLIFTAAFDSGDVVAVPTTCYPCYRNILHALGVQTVSLPLNHEFKVTAKELNMEVERRKLAGEAPLRGLILSSPSNPTGAMLRPQEVRDLCTACDTHNMLYISDEIYHGIAYNDAPEFSALGCDAGRRSSVVINSFSKYYCMTGWRLGWVVVPQKSLRHAVNSLAQNMYINAPTLSQRAAVAALQPSVKPELDAHVKRYAANRQIILSKLDEMGLSGHGRVAPADGAFYIYVDLGDSARADSTGLCRRLLEEAGVASAPGTDFEDPASGLGHQRIRFSYCMSSEEIAEGMERFAQWWPKWLAGNSE